MRQVLSDADLLVAGHVGEPIVIAVAEEDSVEGTAAYFDAFDTALWGRQPLQQPPSRCTAPARNISRWSRSSVKLHQLCRGQQGSLPRGSERGGPPVVEAAPVGRLRARESRCPPGIR